MGSPRRTDGFVVSRSSISTNASNHSSPTTPSGRRSRQQSALSTALLDAAILNASPSAPPPPSAQVTSSPPPLYSPRQLTRQGGASSPRHGNPDGSPDPIPIPGQRRSARSLCPQTLAHLASVGLAYGLGDVQARQNAAQRRATAQRDDIHDQCMEDIRVRGDRPGTIVLGNSEEDSLPFAFNTPPDAVGGFQPQTRTGAQHPSRSVLAGQLIASFNPVAGPSWRRPQIEGQTSGAPSRVRPSATDDGGSDSDGSSSGKVDRRSKGKYGKKKTRGRHSTHSPVQVTHGFHVNSSSGSDSDSGKPLIRGEGGAPSRRSPKSRSRAGSSPQRSRAASRR